jgi:hypothetical protein
VIRLAKLIVGIALLVWAGLLFLGRLNPTPSPVAVTNTDHYVQIAVLLTPFVFTAIGLSLILSARRRKKP